MILMFFYNFKQDNSTTYAGGPTYTQLYGQNFGWSSQTFWWRTLYDTTKLRAGSFHSYAGARVPSYVAYKSNWNNTGKTLLEIEWSTVPQYGDFGVQQDWTYNDTWKYYWMELFDPSLGYNVWAQNGIGSWQNNNAIITHASDYIVINDPKEKKVKKDQGPVLDIPVYFYDNDKLVHVTTTADAEANHKEIEKKYNIKY